MSNIDKRALREAAEKATPGNWWIDSHGQAMVSFIDNDVLEVFATDNKRTAVRHEDTGNLSRWRNDNDATFIATADPATVLALLDELEAAHELVELQRFKLERQAEDLHQAKSLESIHREKRFEVEREYSDYKHRAESNSMRLAKEVCRLEDMLQAAGIRINGEG